jgi:hypothetical protein
MRDAAPSLRVEAEQCGKVSVISFDNLVMDSRYLRQGSGQVSIHVTGNSTMVIRECPDPLRPYGFAEEPEKAARVVAGT